MLKFKNQKFIAFLLGLILIVSGCGGGVNNSDTVVNNANSTESGNKTVVQTKKLKIQVSIYPMYEFTKNVAGDLAEVEVLVPGGMEPHDWEPTPQDLKKIAESDVLVYNGAGMEGWIDQVLSAVSNDKLVKIEASHGLDIMEGSDEEVHEHEGEEAHDHEGEEAHDHNGEEAHEHEGEEAHEHAEEGHHHDHGGLDPHVWLSPTLAIKEVRNIEAGLVEAAPEHKDEFKKNADEYVAALEQLDQEFKDGLSNTKRKDFITQHAAFGYLAKEYGLTQVPIAGLSPEQEPSAEKMTEIVKFAKEHHVKTIFFETLVSSKVADTIAKEIGAQSAVLNPIEGLTDEDKANNLDYLSIMRQNLEGLKAALNE
ncbi:metal ABC transporter substrate-binding protein [Paenibacillus anaericanus]|uniref:metal ABC transporter substrate-binding protein n=1 Tax=Paenibacillus anaericanus TaxID=170367 RepID=UPI003CCC6733